MVKYAKGYQVIDAFLYCVDIQEVSPRIKFKLPTNSFTQGYTLAKAGHHDHNFSAIEYRGHTNGQGHAWDGRDVVIEEPSIGENGIISKRLDASAGGERRP